MFKKILAGLLALTLVLMCFGCGNDSPSKNKLAADQKIAILVEANEDLSDSYRTAKQLAAANPDNVIIISYGADYVHVDSAVADAAASVAGDPSVKAILFADAVAGTADAVRQVRETRSDIVIAVCNPYEETALFAENADLVFGLDTAAFADALVAQAKTFGAETFEILSTARHMNDALTRGVYDGIKAACKKEKLEFDSSAIVDMYAENKSIDDAALVIAETGARKTEKFGKKTVMFCTESIQQGALAETVSEHELYMAGTFLPSPLTLAAGCGVDLTGHETDSAYAVEQLKATAAESGLAGRVATWSFSETAAVMQAAYDYAVGIAAGDNGTVLEPEAAQTLVQQYAGDAEVTVKADDSGAYLLSASAITL